MIKNCDQQLTSKNATNLLQKWEAKTVIAISFSGVQHIDEKIQARIYGQTAKICLRCVSISISLE